MNAPVTGVAVEPGACEAAGIPVDAGFQPDAPVGAHPQFAPQIVIAPMPGQQPRRSCLWTGGSSTFAVLVGCVALHSVLVPLFVKDETLYLATTLLVGVPAFLIAFVVATTLIFAARRETPRARVAAFVQCAAGTLGVGLAAALVIDAVKPQAQGPRAGVMHAFWELEAGFLFVLLSALAVLSLVQRCTAGEDQAAAPQHFVLHVPQQCAMQYAGQPHFFVAQPGGVQPMFVVGGGAPQADYLSRPDNRV